MSKLNLTLALLVLSLVPNRGFAVTNAVVGTCKVGTVYTTIQAAVNAASSGSTVSVCPGTYAEQVTITTPLTLKGIGQGSSNAAIIRPPAAGLVANSLSGIWGTLYVQVLVHGTQGSVTLSNIVIDGGGGTTCPTSGYRVGLLYQGPTGVVTNSSFVDSPQCPASIAAFFDVTTGVKFTNNILTDCGGMCLEVDYATNTTVSGNSIVAFQNTSVGIEMADLEGPASITNNNVSGNFAFGLTTQAAPSVTITGNTIVTPTADGGIVLFGATQNLVQNNHISSGYGIVMEDTGAGAGNTVNNNTIKNATCGLTLVTGSTDVTTPNTFFSSTANICKISIV